MKTFIVPTLGEPVGLRWMDLQNKFVLQGEFNVAAPLSSTPLPIYDWIIHHASDFHHWHKVNFVLMDEMLEGDAKNYSYVPKSDPASYEGFAQKNFTYPLSIATDHHITILKPDLKDLENFQPPIHLLILAIGVHGNFANVMPGTQLETGWHRAYLTDQFRTIHTQASSQSYANAHFREYGMSLGPQQVLKAEHVIVIASGEKKRELVKTLRELDHFDPHFPISIVYHPKVKDRVELYFTKDSIS